MSSVHDILFADKSADLSFCLCFCFVATVIYLDKSTAELFAGTLMS